MRLTAGKFNFIHGSIIGLAVLLGVTSSLIMPKAYAFSKSSERLITIHDRGQEKGLITSASTLRDVFEQANIALDKNDIVEPGLDEKLISNNYQVNIYRARPVLIIDGSVRQLTMSAYQTPKQIAQQAGISLRDEDTATLEASDDLIRDGASLQMVIDRAVPVQLTLYGEKATVYTQATTVNGFLEEKNIKLADKDTVSANHSAKISANMQLAIWREGKQTVTRKEAIQFGVEQIQDVNRPLGYKKIDTPGANGKQIVTYEVEMHDGKEVGRKAIQKVVIRKAVKQVETIGTKVSLPPGSHDDWMRQAGMSSGNYGYINYIFVHESGWNPASRSTSGYVGLGQTNEGNLSSACSGWQSDPICQIRFFNGYAVSRYGSWEAAYNFKASHGWW
jgi:uncharacterized protein YabE (DUF348 family)